jgi:hypothetical protein
VHVLDAYPVDDPASVQCRERDLPSCTQHSLPESATLFLGVRCCSVHTIHEPRLDEAQLEFGRKEGNLLTSDSLSDRSFGFTVGLLICTDHPRLALDICMHTRRKHVSEMQG